MCKRVVCGAELVYDARSQGRSAVGRGRMSCATSNLAHPLPPSLPHSLTHCTLTHSLKSPHSLTHSQTHSRYMYPRNVSLCILHVSLRILYPSSGDLGNPGETNLTAGFTKNHFASFLPNRTLRFAVSGFRNRREMTVLIRVVL